MCCPCAPVGQALAVRACGRSGETTRTEPAARRSRATHTIPSAAGRNKNASGGFRERPRLRGETFPVETPTQPTAASFGWDVCEGVRSNKEQQHDVRKANHDHERMDEAGKQQTESSANPSSLDRADDDPERRRGGERARRRVLVHDVERRVSNGVVSSEATRAAAPQAASESRNASCPIRQHAQRRKTIAANCQRKSVAFRGMCVKHSWRPSCWPRSIRVELAYSRASHRSSDHEWNPTGTHAAHVCRIFMPHIVDRREGNLLRPGS